MNAAQWMVVGLGVASMISAVVTYFAIVRRLDDTEDPVFYPRGHAGPKELLERPTDAQVPRVKPLGRPPIDEDGGDVVWKP